MASHMESNASLPILELRCHFAHRPAVATHLHTAVLAGFPPLDCFGTFYVTIPTVLTEGEFRTALEVPVFRLEAME